MPIPAVPLERFAPGDRVTVHSFGAHAGTVTGLDPVMTVQGRTWQAKGWVTVRLDDGRTWNGTPAHCERRDAPALAA